MEQPRCQREPVLGWPQPPRLWSPGEVNSSAQAGLENGDGGASRGHPGKAVTGFLRRGWAGSLHPFSACRPLGSPGLVLGRSAAVNSHKWLMPGSQRRGEKPPELAGGMILLQETAKIAGELLSCPSPTPSASQYIPVPQPLRLAAWAGGSRAAELSRVQKTRESQHWKTRAGGSCHFCEEMVVLRGGHTHRLFSPCPADAHREEGRWSACRPPGFREVITHGLG